MAFDPVIGGFIADAAVATAQAVTRGGPRRQYKWNKKAAEDANRMNRENQQWLLQQNKELQDEQRAYDLATNSPKAQMERYLAAGLNPHLIYGGGSNSAASQVFGIDAGGVPGVNVQPPSGAWPDVAGSFLRAGQTMAGTQLTEAKTVESQMRTQVLEVQNEIARTNPMLNPEVANWVATSVTETARLKTMESRSWLAPHGKDQIHIQAKVHNEVEAMSQRLGINTSDLAIKNRILESKDFENAIKKINLDWLKDGEMSPEHMRQGLMLILSKMMGK